MGTLAVGDQRGLHLDGMTTVNSDIARGWLHESECRLDDIIAIVEQPTELSDYPHAASIDKNTVVYDCDHLRSVVSDPGGRRAVQAELAHAFLEGPGIIAFQRAFADTTVIDEATTVFQAMIAEQRASGMAAGDHYAKPGHNDRVWNALEKLAVLDPDVFIEYYSNDIIALASAAWLGPGYTLTSQVNVVNPGGLAQSPHRDYHLGFMTVERAEEYPAHIHLLSAALTLAGRRRPLRHAHRKRADDVPAWVAEVPPRLPRLAAAGVQGVLRRAPHAAGAEER